MGAFLRRHPVSRLPIAWIPISLIVGALLTHYRWLTVLPLSAADWRWASDGMLQSWFPWPSIWDPFVGFGSKSFSGAFAFPTEAVAGFLGLLGVEWNFGEKVVYFLPFAILSFLAPWLLARDLLRSPRWAILSALIFASNTYLLLVSTGGQMLVAMAQAIAPLVLWAFLRALRQLSIADALLCGLLFAVQAVYEVRIAYLTGLLCVLYLMVLVVCQPNLRLALHRALLALVPVAVLLGTHLYWLLPFVTYHGDRGLPIASAPWIAFMRVTHGITGVHPFWTGGTPTVFSTVPLNPVFFLFPLVAFGILLKRRLEPETLWLCVVALAAAFLIKQTNPPFGGVYDWLFVHFPGWSAFREASKLFFIVALSYAVLVPMSLQQLRTLRLGTLRVGRLRTDLGLAQRLPSAIAVGAAAAVLALCANNFIPALTGQLGFTTQPRQEPNSFAALAALLDTNKGSGTVVWLGGAFVGSSNNGTDHHFPIASANHPILGLTGFDPSNDVLTRYCRSTLVPFCYVEPELFPYLMDRIGAGYVVAPAGSEVGTLPPGVSYAPLLTRLATILGQPTFIGDGRDRLAVWEIRSDVRPVTASPVVALVDGTSNTTQSALPALQALGIPAAFRPDGLPAAHRSPAGPHIEILPGTSGSYDVQSTGRFALAARSQQSTLPVVDGDQTYLLKRLWTASAGRGWSMYGPVDLEAGQHRLATTDPIDLGPLMAWSQLAADTLAGNRVQLLASTSSQPERVVVDRVPNGGHWIELRRAYDVGWTLGSASPDLVGDGIFNLYWVSRPGPTATFSFSTAAWEKLGIAASLGVTVVVLVLWLFARRRAGARAVLETSPGVQAGLLTEAASQTAWIGFLLVAVAAIFQCIGWWSMSLPASVEPYSSAELYAALAVGFLLLSISCHVAAHNVQAARWYERIFNRRARRT